MKRQAAFIDAKKHLKGALHCHTTRSDGKGTPEEVLKKHAEHGYDFVALTDHRYYNFANYGDAPLTIIPGMEMDGNLPGAGWPYVTATTSSASARKRRRATASSRISASRACA